VFHDGANEAEEGGGDVCLAFRERYEQESTRQQQQQQRDKNYTRPSHVLCGRNSREVIAHLCVFMPNQAQQQAVAPCVIDWEGRRGRGGGREGHERGREEIVLAVIRHYLAVTALVSLNS